MLKTLTNIIFSTKLTALFLFIFAAACGVATFIENDYGTPAAKSVVYNARWFEFVIFILTINLIGNIFKYKLYAKHKLAVFTFHLALIVIVIGAAVTRYIGFEGLMPIREGNSTNLIVSDETYFQFKVDDRIKQYTFDKKLFLNTYYNSKFNYGLTFNNKNVEVSYAGFLPNAIDTVEKKENGDDYLELVTVGQVGRESKYLKNGITKSINGLLVAFNDTTYEDAIKILTTDSGLIVNSPFEIQYMKMDDQSKGTLKQDTIHKFEKRRLYNVGGIQIVYKDLHKGVGIKKISVSKDRAKGTDVLVVNVKSGNEQKQVNLAGGKGFVSPKTEFKLNGLNFTLGYGSTHIAVPFQVRLNDFKLERYPGSMSPSSYESEVTLIDMRNNVEFDQRIYMNNVLDYDGYRLFQSSYDQDELGTVLSVNHDFYGTAISYLGYFLLALGMILTLFSKKSRFNTLRNKIKKIRTSRNVMGILLLLGLLAYQTGFTQTNQDSSNHDNHNHEGHTHNSEHNHNEHSEEQIKKADLQVPPKVEISKQHADKFGKLLVQDRGGRIKPLQTMASEIVRKVFRKESYDGMMPAEILLNMIYYPQYWQQQYIIKVSNEELGESLNAKDKYVRFIDLFDDNFRYKLAKDAEQANRKKPAERSKYDKEVIAVDERANICFMVFQGSLLKIFPKPNDENNTWFTSQDYKQFEGPDTLFVKSILPLYYGSISSSYKTNNWALADSALQFISDYQYKHGADVIPEQSKIDIEITYNRVNIFKRLFMYYALVGLVLLLFIFADIFNARKYKKTVVKIFTIILFGLFSLHTLGLIARWYISGYAPWSNGYESMIYIGWATIFAGFLFSRTSKMTLAATSILTALILMVAHLNWLDPEITPLVPVLKSYWLMIHVAIITASYGFLGLGALLGFMNLILMIIKNTNNKTRVNSTIKELTYINEMTLTVGVFMAAVGTFLGGVWANESWGRYWGWDPKETWALVIVLVYSIILHLRLIPKAGGKYLFNLVSVVGFSSVIMTYFGVNYYLSGLHSYAKGDPVPIPVFVYYTIAVIAITAILAYLRNKSNKLI